MKMMWCIMCEQMVAIEEPVQGHTIIQFVPDAGEQEVFWCTGEFVDCAPDEDAYDFDLQDEPSQIGLAKMNLNAEEILQDLGE